MVTLFRTFDKAPPKREREKKSNSETGEKKTKFSLGRISSGIGSFASLLRLFRCEQNITLRNTGVARLSSYYFNRNSWHALALENNETFPLWKFRYLFLPILHAAAYVYLDPMTLRESEVGSGVGRMEKFPASRFDVPLNNRRPATGRWKTAEENLPSRARCIRYTLPAPWSQLSSLLIRRTKLLLGRALTPAKNPTLPREKTSNHQVAKT